MAIDVSDKIFREYDIRGIAGKDLDRDIAVLLGKAFGSFVKQRKPDAGYLSVGRDVRNSSAGLAAGIIEGITSTGLDVYDIGVCPTPVQYFSLFHLDLDGGVMVTGSHNPPEYNGFKLSVGKETIHGGDIQRLREIIANHEWETASREGRVESYHILEAYKDYMLKEFSCLRKSTFRNLKVVVDAGNGTAGVLVPDILREIGCEVTPLYCEPDGNFPHHHPDPTVPEYIRDLIAETKRTRADAGIGYDGDADRIGVVNKEGEIIWGDLLMIVLSREILGQNPGAGIIGDVKCSQVMFDDIGKHGGRPIMWKTGHSLIKQKMRDEGALLAGEFSGHIFIGDRYFGYDDAIYTTLRLVEIMKNTGKDMKDLLSGVPRMSSTPEIRIDCPDDRKKGVVGEVVERFLEYRKNGKSAKRILDLNTIDGVRVLFEKGWVLVRSSNTQPVIVMRAEAEDEESLFAYRNFMEEEIRRARRLG
jgi:phosphomannomutase/phosphoglucomutase